MGHLDFSRIVEEQVMPLIPVLLVRLPRAEKVPDVSSLMKLLALVV